MSDGIVLLRGRGEERSALARVDVEAVGLLAEGQATTLQAARAAVILANLRDQREQMAALLADLQRRAPTGDGQIDRVNADLIIAINRGIVQIDKVTAQVRVRTEEVT
jgi:hypothetical protein